MKAVGRPHRTGEFRIGLLLSSAVSSLLTRPAGARLLVSLLDPFSGNGDAVVSIISGHLAGLKFACNRSTQKYFWLGTFELPVQEALSSHVRSGARVWDLGAFTGFHTLLMRRLAGPGAVTAVEPDPASRKLLLQNLAANRFDDVQVLNLAVLEREGRGRLARVEGGPSQTQVMQDDAGECQVTTLDALLERLGPPSCIKMDIEGAEFAAIRGGRAVLNKVRPTWIVELHGDAGEATVEQFLAAGYVVSALDGWIPEAAPLLGGGARHILAVPAA